MNAKMILALAGMACLSAAASAQTGRLFVGENGFDPMNPPFCYETSLDSGFPGSVSWSTTFALPIQGAACSPQNMIYLTSGVFNTDLYVTIPGRQPSRVGRTSEAIFDMGYLNGHLYGWAEYASPSGIYEINPQTGQCTLVVASTSELFFALDANPVDGLLYGYSEYGQTGLYSINPVTGEKHRVAPSPTVQFPSAYGSYRGLAVGNNTVYLTNSWNGRDIGDPDHTEADTYYAYDLSQGDNGQYVQFTNPYANSTPQLGGSFWYDPTVVAQPPIPANDLRENATPIGEGTFDFDTTWAETDGDASCAPGSTFGDVWFLYTPTYSHYALFSTVNDRTNFDTVMSIYTADGQTELACNDDTGFYSLGSTIGYRVTAGEPILIRIAGWDYGPPDGLQRGPGVLSITDCPGLEILTQPIDGAITRCMGTVPSDGSQGPFYIIVSTELVPHPGTFTFSWEKDGAPLYGDFNGSFDSHGILIQSAGFFSRVIIIRPDATDAGQYRCVITSDDACESTLTVTTRTATLTACAADYNCDGVLNSDDLSDYITGYFNDPADPATDFNHDTVINADDLGDFITSYFNGC